MGPGNLAADAAAARGIRHQDAVAAGQGQVCRQCGALAAALFLDHLNQKDLAPFYDLLDLVLPGITAQTPAYGFAGARNILGFVAAEDLDAVALPLGFVLFALVVHILPRLIQQDPPVGDRDAVIVGVDLVEGEETMAIAAIIDKRRLQRRLDPDDLGQIDVALELFLGGCLEIEFNKTVSVCDDHALFLRVSRVDQHSHCHG